MSTNTIPSNDLTAEHGEIRVMIISPQNLATYESVIEEVEKLHGSDGNRES
jgi:hypothetical protein